MSESLLTAFDVAERLGVAPETVYGWARSGAIEAVRLPSGRFRFRPSVVMAILAERADGAA